MRKVLAVALLDWRRLGFGMASAALIAGLLPSLASGLGAKVEPEVILAWVFVLVGLAAGGTFGNDFGEGRSSFFFARPLSTGALIAGRFVALVVLAAVALVSFMASYWLSSRAKEGFSLWILTRYHLEALASCWAMSLFFALAASGRGRWRTAAGGLRQAVLIPLRLFVSFGSFILVFGLFGDLVVRAYRDDVGPFRLAVGSFVVASLVASLVAIAAGRTEPLRISRFQGGVMLGHFVLATIVVIAAWAFVLHPGPEAIERVERPSEGSPDGRSAFVSATVGRGDGKTFRPVFVLDIASGQARRLNADEFHGPWTSADGGTMVWSEATPFFFRPLWRSICGATTFRVRGPSGEVSVLPMPKNVPDYTSVRHLTRLGDGVDRILPSPEGDVFAVLWDGWLSFTSRSRGELAEVKLGRDRRARSFVRAMSFLPSGELRAVISGQAVSGPNLEFVDIDPKSGAIKSLTSMRVENPGWIRFDATASRVLLSSIAFGNRGATLTLLDFKTGGEPRSTVLLKDVLSPQAVFLADGRIAIASGGSPGAWEKQTLRVLSPTGQTVNEIKVADGSYVGLGNEMFPGVLAVRTSVYTDEMSLIDATSGTLVRNLSGFAALPYFSASPPPPGTPAARLLQSRDGRLYELPSITGEPRLLLPSARP